MILLNVDGFYIAFNWNPVVKHKKFRYRKFECGIIIDIWKFRICNFKRVEEKQ